MSRKLSCPSCHSKIAVDVIPQSGAVTCRDCGKSVILKTSGIIKKSDRIIADELLEKGFITRQQIDAAFSEQQERTEEGNTVPIATVLLEKNYIKKSELKDILGKAKESELLNIPGYRFIGKLGGGGMGNVYKAVRISDNKDVAVKILSGTLAKRKEFVERFEREAKVAISLDHPHIVKGYEVGSHNDNHYFAMEYVHGKSAERVLQKRIKFGEKRALDICRQIAEALAVAAKRGLVHRDIKPGNIILTREGYAKLADYGLVKITDDEALVTLTLTGQIMGTPYYISPEQAAGEKEIDIRSDIYSLGATLYHLATGTTPYRGRSGADIMAMHICGKLENPKEHSPELSDKACDIILRMMQKEKDKRFQTPQELISAIQEYFTGDSEKTVNHTSEELVEDTEFEAESSDSSLATIMSEWFSTPASRFFSDKKKREKIVLAGILACLVFLGLFLGQLISILKNKHEANEKNSLEKIVAPYEKLYSILSSPEEKALKLKKFVAAYKGSDAAFLALAELEALKAKESTDAPEKAYEIYLRSKFTDEEKRLSYLNQITDQYPSAELAKQAQKEIDSINAEIARRERKEALADKRARQQEEARLRRIAFEKLEKEAATILKSAMLASANPEAYSKALKNFIAQKKYLQTRSYKRAKNELFQVEKKIEQQRKREDQELSQIRAREEFRRVSRKCIFDLIKNEPEKAWEKISAFWQANRSRFARKLAAPLYHDLSLLNSIDKRFEEIIEEKTGGFIIIKMRNEGTLKGNLLEIDKVQQRFKMDLTTDHEVERRLSSVLPEEKLRYILEAAQNKKEEVEAKTLLALTLLLDGETEKAKEIFTEIRKSDPHHKHHKNIIEEFESFEEDF